MASVRGNVSHNPEHYKDQSPKRPTVTRGVGARCVALCGDMEPLPSSQSLATASSPQSALRYDKLSLWLTAKEQLQALEEKLAQLAAKSSKMRASTDGKHITKECLSILTRQSSKVKNISSRNVGEIQNQKKDLTGKESSLEVKKAELFHLRERNARLAREVCDTEADIESLKEARAIHQKRLDDVSGKRLEIKCQNSKLRKKNTRLLAEQQKHTYNQIQMKEELELQERELRAALKTNQNLRREAKSNEGKFRRFRRWVQRKWARLLRIR